MYHLHAFKCMAKCNKCSFVLLKKRFSEMCLSCHPYGFLYLVVFLLRQKKVVCVHILYVTCEQTVKLVFSFETSTHFDFFVIEMHHPGRMWKRKLSMKIQMKNP